MTTDFVGEFVRHANRIAYLDAYQKRRMLVSDVTAFNELQAIPGHANLYFKDLNDRALVASIYEKAKLRRRVTWYDVETLQETEADSNTFVAVTGRSDMTTTVSKASRTTRFPCPSPRSLNERTEGDYHGPHSRRKTSHGSACNADHPQRQRHHRYCRCADRIAGRRPELGFSREPASAVAEAIVAGIEENAFEVIRGGEARAQIIALNRENPAAVDERFLGLKPALEEAVKDHSAL